MGTIAILSDIHANIVALDAVIGDLAACEPEQVVCLGDVAATGPTPRQVIARLREQNWRFVRGNCDDAMLRIAAGAAEPAVGEHDTIDRWCTEQLDSEDIAFLATFEPVVTLEAGDVSICCYHGSPRSNLDEILPETAPHDLDRWFLGHHAEVYAGGHTHVQMMVRYRAAFVINPGSVGLPFSYLADGTPSNPPWAEYALLEIDGDRIGVEMRRTPVDRAALLESATESAMPQLEWWSGN